MHKASLMPNHIPYNDTLSWWIGFACSYELMSFIRGFMPLVGSLKSNRSRVSNLTKRGSTDPQWPNDEERQGEAFFLVWTQFTGVLPLQLPMMRGGRHE